MATAGQSEIDLRFQELVRMADSLLIFKYIIKNVARKHGKTVTFMPKPVADVQGSGMHLHMSLFKGTKNLFFDARSPMNISDTARHYVAGLLRYASELTAVTNQLVNSYKRLVAGFDAPIWVSWGLNNQSALVRVPTVKKNKPDSVRVEYRSADSAANPYLTLAVLLAAGDPELHLEGHVHLAHPFQITLADLDILFQGFFGQVDHMGTEQRCSVIPVMGLTGVQESVDPREQLFGAVVRMKDDRSPVGLGKLVHVFGPGNGPQDCSALPFIGKPFPGVELGSPV